MKFVPLLAGEVRQDAPLHPGAPDDAGQAQALVAWKIVGTGGAHAHRLDALFVAQDGAHEPRDDHPDGRVGVPLAADDLVGGVAGLLVGFGTMLHLPYFVRRSGSRGGPAPGDSYADRAAVGLALDAAGIVAFGSRFVADGYLVPLAAAAVVALVLYIPLDRFLPPVQAGA